jgi:hypothetical protein
LYFNPAIPVSAGVTRSKRRLAQHNHSNKTDEKLTPEAMRLTTVGLKIPRQLRIFCAVT